MLRQGLTIAIAGTVAGGLAAAWLSRALDAQLYTVTSHDPVTFIAVPLFVLLSSVLTCLIPALRAARQDPLAVLRESF